VLKNRRFLTWRSLFGDFSRSKFLGSRKTTIHLRIKKRSLLVFPDKKDFLYAVNEPGLYYLFATFVYGLVVRDYAAFLVFTVMQLSYNAVKYGFYYAGWSGEL